MLVFTVGLGRCLGILINLSFSNVVLLKTFFFFFVMSMEENEDVRLKAQTYQSKLLFQEFIFFSLPVLTTQISELTRPIQG